MGGLPYRLDLKPNLSFWLDIIHQTKDSSELWGLVKSICNVELQDPEKIKVLESKWALHRNNTTCRITNNSGNNPIN